jgi:hypothetical protein
MLLNIRTYLTKVTSEALDDIKDDEVKRELAKGNTLIRYIEYPPQ